MATAYVGAKKEIAFTKESVRNTAQDVQAGDWQPHEGFGFRPMTSFFYDELARGRVEQRSGHAINEEWSEGPVPLFVGKEFLGHVNNMLFGQAPTTTGPAGDKYTHTWAVQNNVGQYLTYTVTVKDPVRGVKRYPGALPGDVTFTFKRDDYAKVELQMIGGKEESYSATPSYSTTEGFFLPQHITLKFADTYAGLAAAQATELKSFSLVRTMPVQRHTVLGNTEAVERLNERMSIGGAMELLYDNATFYDLGLSANTKFIEVDLNDGAGITAKYIIMDCGFENPEDSTDLNPFQTLSLDYFGQRDDTYGLITAELVNTIPSY